MKKICKKQHILLMILLIIPCIGTVFGTGDSLISLSYMKNTYLNVMKDAVAQGVSEVVDPMYQEKLQELENLRIEYGYGAGNQKLIEIAPGYQVVFASGTSFLVYEGNLLMEKEGSVVDLSQGIEVPAGVVEQGHHYLVAEDGIARLSGGTGGAKIAVQGQYAMAEGGVGDSFIDVNPGDWFYSAVDFVKETQLFTGTTVNTFSPDEPMDRAMMVTVLYRLAGSPQAELDAATAVFSDVAEESWYHSFVSWAASSGLVTGVGEGKFAPEKSVTRQEVAIMLYAFAEKNLGRDMNQSADLSVFQDGGEVAFWAQPSMEWMVANQLFYGIPDSSTHLKGEDFAKRAEVASMLMCFYDEILSE